MAGTPVYQYGSNESILNPPSKWSDTIFNTYIDPFCDFFGQNLVILSKIFVNELVLLYYFINILSVR